VTKKVYGLAFVLSLLFLALVGLMLVDLATADPYVPPPPAPILGINSDGSVTPRPDLISRNGSYYTLTADVDEYQIHIAASNIIFDGNGHKIRITTAASPGIYLYKVTNVTLKDFDISVGSDAVRMYFCSNCTVTGIKSSRDIFFSSCDFNTLTGNEARIYLYIDSRHNLISRNNITHIAVSLECHSNSIYLNNMLMGEDDPPYLSQLTAQGNLWDNGSIGNYWIVYETLYSSASEIAYSGIGDTPYILNKINVDHYPLMYPYDIENGAIALPEREPLPEPEPEPEPFPTTLVVAASGVSAAVIAVGCAVYFVKFRKRREVAEP
jgi:hypothetical protein